MTVLLPVLFTVLWVAFMTWAIVDIQHRRNAYILPRTQQKTIVKEVPVMQTIGNGLIDKSASDLAVAIEHLSATLKHRDQVVLGAEALQNKSLDIINRLLDERTQTREISVESDVSRTVQELSKVSPLAVQETSREELVKQYLSEYPEASLREIERETGVPKTSVALIKNTLKGGK